MIFKEGYTVIYKNGEIYKLGKIAKSNWNSRRFHAWENI